MEICPNLIGKAGLLCPQCGGGWASEASKRLLKKTSETGIMTKVAEMRLFNDEFLCGPMKDYIARTNHRNFDLFKNIGDLLT